MFTPRIRESHWYDPVNGNPCHSVPYKDKKRAGETRPTTLKDARELGLVPSVTNLLGIIANDSLNDWKAQQVLLASLTLSQAEGESDQDFVNRVIRDSEAYTRQTANLGTRIHDAIEKHLTGKMLEDDEEVLPLVSPVLDWLGANVTEVLGAEKRVVGNGYAGTVDLLCHLKGYEAPVIMDFKTRSPSKGKLPSRNSDLWQLCGYDLAAGYQGAVLANLYVNRLEASPPELRVWDAEEKAWGTKVFLDALSLWRSVNKFTLS